MKTNRFILLLLALLLTTSSCGTTTNESDTSDGAGQDIVLQETETETETELKDAVPEDLNFGGANFIFLAADDYGAPSLVEGLNGDVYNDATYEVEVYAEERLDVNISEELTGLGQCKANCCKSCNIE